MLGCFDHYHNLWARLLHPQVDLGCFQCLRIFGCYIGLCCPCYGCVREGFCRKNTMWHPRYGKRVSSRGADWGVKNMLECPCEWDKCDGREPSKESMD